MYNFDMQNAWASYHFLGVTIFVVNAVTFNLQLNTKPMTITFIFLYKYMFYILKLHLRPYLESSFCTSHDSICTTPNQNEITSTSAPHTYIPLLYKFTSRLYILGSILYA